ncbi:proline iminopeptidase-family hydrolase [Neolewinella antarctica]|uniref:Proline iminopeptidase n=1 Tax=Neolewinella antarctica TaxID=442734 RepID=A0ABX0XBH7_9BACT|nr:proline iminopeptidase-family hydrolase [Neolewinella antarctica]NJC26279.1 proline iminopeptidase [Neolewinella antarctica]
MRLLITLIFLALTTLLCTCDAVVSPVLSRGDRAQAQEDVTGNPLNLADYHDYSDDPEAQFAGGVRMIPITTPSGDFKVWTKRVGNNPKTKVLLLHGGPGVNYAYFECFDGFLPGAGIEYIYYDQLGSWLSDQPTDTSLWQIDRFVDEVEQVRQALDLGADNFYILGHSWGGILGLEYALQHQDKMKGLIISNMMVSVSAYNKYADEVLGPQLDQDTLSSILAFEEKGDFANPEYFRMISENFYPKHVLRMPMAEWPEPVNRAFEHANGQIYVQMQGPSEFGIRGGASLTSWERRADLPKITIPVLTIGGQYDTMDPEHMREIADEFPNGSHLHCPNGSHMSFYDDQAVYFAGLIDWLQERE